MDDLMPPHVVRRNLARLYQLIADMCRPTPRAPDPDRQAAMHEVIARLQAGGSPIATARARELEAAIARPTVA